MANIHYTKSTQCSRRDFLRKSLAGCSAGVLAGGAACIGCEGMAYPALAARASIAQRPQPGRLTRAEQPVLGRRVVDWKTHVVARIPEGYQVAVADVDGDGRPDILGLSSGRSIVEWYQNPSWAARPVTSATKGNISLAPLFKEAYPLRGLALATDFSLDDSEHGGNVWWAEPRTDLDSEWALRLIGTIPTSHRLRWADLEGDGRLALVDVPLLGYGAKPPEYSAGAPLTWFEPPRALFQGHSSAEQRHATDWIPHLIDNSLTVVHGVTIVDWDGDGRDEILTASFEGVHLFKSSGHWNGLLWKKTRLCSGDQVSRPRRGSSEIGVGRVGGRKFLATIEPWHGEQVVVYLESKPGELWTRQVIDSSFRDGHALACADLDGDGNHEIVAGFRGQGTSLYVYYAIDPSGLHWQRQLLDNEMAASGVAVADMNGDGRLDVIAIGASTGSVKWYENLRPVVSCQYYQLSPLYAKRTPLVNRGG